MKTLITILLFIPLFSFGQHHMMSVLASQGTPHGEVIITTTGASTWTVPAGVTSITVECWGAGGQGGSATGYPACGGGGGGGAYASSTLSVTPSTVYDVFVGANLQNTWFGSTTTILADAGNAGGNATSNSSNGGAGVAGRASGSIGDIKYDGGSGYAGNYSTPRSGSGGGAAGISQVGGTATASAGGTGYCNVGTNTGDGRTGRTTVGAGAAGLIYGGGGAGGYATSATDRAGGGGGQGVIRITY